MFVYTSDFRLFPNLQALIPNPQLPIPNPQSLIKFVFKEINIMTQQPSLPLEDTNQSTEQKPAIIAQDVHKWYSSNKFYVLRGVSLTVNRGEVVVIMGPSGSGKSTFIRTFNALEEYQKGRIEIDGIELSHDIRNIDAIRKEVGMVFQQFNLFPHLSVLKNVTLAPIWVRRWPKKKAEEVAMQLLERVRSE